jgi:signal transduction histidine kinase/putative methionine-R-sulfoxide reductase with GAF domain/ActR/RegA family two-component response regulator
MTWSESAIPEAFGQDTALAETLKLALALVGGERGLILEFGAAPANDRVCACIGYRPGALPVAVKTALDTARRGATAPAGAPFALFLKTATTEPVGVMLLDKAPADARAGEFLQGLAAAMQSCLTQGRLYEAERKRRAQAEIQAQAARTRLDEIRAFDNMARAISSMLDPDDILRYIMDQAQALFNAEAASVALLDESGTAVIFQMAVGAGAAGAIGQKVRLGQGIAGWVAQTGESVRVADTRADKRWYSGVDKQSGFSTRNLMCAPMTLDERIVGVMEVINRRADTFDENDLRLLEAVSAQVGAALKNARLFRQTRRRAEELSILLETGQAITSSLDSQNVLREIAVRAGRALKGDGCVIYLIDAGKAQLRPVVAQGPYSDQVLTAPVPLSQGLSGWVARNGAGRIMNSAHLHPDAFRVPGTPIDPESLISVPLQTKGETVGVMTVSRVGEGVFTDEDLHFLNNMATQASVAMVNAQLYEAARENAARLAALQEIAKAINASLDLNAIIETVMAEIGRLAPRQEFTLALYDVDKGGLYQHQPLKDQAGLNERVIGWMHEALDMGVPLLKETGDAGRGTRAAYLVAPIIAENRRLGALLLADQHGEGFPIVERAVVAELANHLALAIQNARLYQERDKAYRDLAEAQQQLVMSEKLRALGQMASGIAHNFNNVLAVVLGRAQLALRRVDTDDGLRLDLDAIVRAARDGATIVRRLQEFTRLRPDEKSLQILDPNDVIAGIAEITRPRWKDQMDAEGRSVSLICETADVPRIAGNPSELREVLTNLIFNALDAMPQGGNIFLRVGQEDQNVTISVEDTGIGMSEAVRSRVFEPFFTTKGPQNSGLGMSTSYGIIARHGGEIRVESEPNKGSRFTIVLPAVQGWTPAEEKQTVGGSTRPTRRGRVLLVDDEAELCRIIKRALEGQGHTVSAFMSGHEALATFNVAPQSFDLVITDLGMPVISGWDLSAAIRSKNADLPIVMITGWGDRLDNHLVKQHRITAVLAKPFDIEDLLRLTAETLKKK